MLIEESYVLRLAGTDTNKMMGRKVPDKLPKVVTLNSSMPKVASWGEDESEVRWDGDDLDKVDLSYMYVNFVNGDGNRDWGWRIRCVVWGGNRHWLGVWGGNRRWLGMWCVVWGGNRRWVRCCVWRFNRRVRVDKIIGINDDVSEDCSCHDSLIEILI